MYLYLKSLASSNISLTGDNGKPNLSISAGATKTVLIQDANGNTVFCDSCATLIDGGHLEVLYGSPTGHSLTSSEMEAVKNGTAFDLNDNGIVDEAEVAIGALVDPMTERGDIIFRNATVPAALHHGTAGDVLQSGGHGADPSWYTPGTMIAEDAADYIADALLTEQGDVIYASAASTPAALPHGAAGDVLQSGGHAANPSWLTPGTMITANAADYIANALLTEQGDVIYASAASTPAALPHGAAGDVLQSGGHAANPSWLTPGTMITANAADYIANALVTEQGDILYGSAASTPAVLAHGAAGDYLSSGGHAANPSWVTPGTMISANAADYIANALVTEQGDIIYASAASTPAALAHGAAGDVLQSGGHAANPSWLTPGTMITANAADYIANALLTEQGDIIYASAASTPAALAHGNAGQVLTSGGHAANPAWGEPPKYGDFPGEQAILADATIRTWIAPGTGNLYSAYARVATAHSGTAGNEHSHIDVLKNGVTCLTGTIDLVAGSGTNAVAGVLAGAGAADFVAGDIFTITEDYTLDGTGGDTGANLAVCVEYQLD